MCTEYRCCWMHVLTATIIYSVLWMLYSALIITACVFTILKPNEKCIQQLNITRPEFTIGLESIRCLLLFLLFIGAIAVGLGLTKKELLIKIYYGFGIVYILVLCAVIILSTIQKKYAEVVMGLLVLVVYALILHFLIRRAYKSLSDDEYD